ncbi:MAG: hypothetical protein FWF30_02355, partial [Coriobacteriia bacterium]|nr:hypothetical protein [Coriobacteriia bacterium]
GISTAQVYQRFDRELEAAQGGQASQAAQGGQAASAVGAGQATPTDQATPAAPATPPDQPAPAGNGLAGLLRGTPASTAQEVAQFMENNLEPAALALCPECRTIIEQLKAQDGVLKAMVSGSGSTVFALCESQAAALAAARWFAQPGQPGHWTCVTRTTPASET